MELDGCLLLQVLHTRVEFDFLLVNVLVESPLVVVFEVGVRHSLVLRLLLLNVVLRLLHAHQELFEFLVLPLFL